MHSQPAFLAHRSDSPAPSSHGSCNGRIRAVDGEGALRRQLHMSIYQTFGCHETHVNKEENSCGLQKIEIRRKGIVHGLSAKQKQEGLCAGVCDTQQ